MKQNNLLFFLCQKNVKLFFCFPQAFKILDGGLYDNASMDMEGPNIESGYSGDSCTVVDNNVSFNTSLNAPGSMRYFTIKATNNGTIDALAPIYVSSTKEACVSQEMKEQAGFGGKPSCHRFLFDTSYYTFTSGLGVIEYDFEDFSTAYILEKPDGILINLLAIPEEEALTYIDEEGDNLKMPAGYTIYYVGKFFVPEDYQFYSNVNMIDLSLKADY